jgi:hypothetical protein
MRADGEAGLTGNAEPTGKAGVDGGRQLVTR